MAAHQGNVFAQNNLGNTYFYGQGMPQSDKETVKWYQKAAEQGHDGAQCALAGMYLFGRGVLQNPLKAFNWWLKSAEQGNAQAQFNLGTILQEGDDGVPQNHDEAAKWLEKAVGQGYPGARKTLVELRLKQEHDKISRAGSSSVAASSTSCCASCGIMSSSSKLRTCSRCKKVSYCSRDCQAAHWNEGHRAACVL